MDVEILYQAEPALKMKIKKDKFSLIRYINDTVLDSLPDHSVSIDDWVLDTKELRRFCMSDEFCTYFISWGHRMSPFYANMAKEHCMSKFHVYQI